ncbi:MAG TPA: hypothetical protein PK306_01400 [Aquabacterium sp.]|nr:hypothetical protein [Aquabacterium sp.]
MKTTLEASIAECEVYIRDVSAQRAFQLLVDSFCASAGFEARPHPHGYLKRDVSIYCEGERFIHVHHLTPLAAKEGQVDELDPVRDLRPVCPNRHAMLHQTEPPQTIDGLRQRLRP